MSGSMSTAASTGLVSPTLSSSASAAALQSPTAASAAAATGSTALSSLSSNYQTFLNLLMTQLQNQDPSSPMDANQFTTELVQFSSVEQQINTNSSLTQLIQLTQTGSLLQSSSMVGHTVAVSGSDMPVQGGAGQISFNATTPGPVTISVYNSSGVELGQSTMTASKGSNTWSWNATDGSGNVQPDGAYKVVVTSTDSTGATTTLPFTAIGKATGVVKNGSSLQLQIGAVTTDFSNVQTVLD